MNPDFKELLLAFNAHDVEYLIVGAHALAAHGHVRATKDLDLWVRPEKSNAQKVLQALSDFGAPLSDLAADDLSRKETMRAIEGRVAHTFKHGPQGRTQRSDSLPAFFWSA